MVGQMPAVSRRIETCMVDWAVADTAHGLAGVGARGEEQPRAWRGMGGEDGEHRALVGGRQVEKRVEGEDQRRSGGPRTRPRNVGMDGRSPRHLAR